jgi:hypothetical protein
VLLTGPASPAPTKAPPVKKLTTIPVSVLVGLLKKLMKDELAITVHGLV